MHIADVAALYALLPGGCIHDGRQTSQKFQVGPVSSADGRSGAIHRVIVSVDSR
jgi:hypothetical protein